MFKETSKDVLAFIKNSPSCFHAVHEMKKILFFALVAFLGIQSVDAQRNGGKRRTPEQMVEMLDKKLDLTEDQEKQITALYTDFFAEKLSREERKTKMEELESKIKSLLNDEQKTAYDQMKKERPQRSK